LAHDSLITFSKKLFGFNFDKRGVGKFPKVLLKHVTNKIRQTFQTFDIAAFWPYARALLFENKTMASVWNIIILQNLSGQIKFTQIRSVLMPHYTAHDMAWMTL